jgi:hypothetical protein
MTDQSYVMQVGVINIHQSCILITPNAGWDHVHLLLRIYPISRLSRLLDEEPLKC